jgi:hypothetical protein
VDALALARLLLEARLRLDGDRRELALGQVPPMEVQREHVRRRAVAAAPLLEPRLDAGVLAGAVAVAAVEDAALVEDDGLEQAVLADVGHELAELGALDLQKREEVGGRVVVEDGGRRGGSWAGGVLHGRYSVEGGGCYVLGWVGVGRGPVAASWQRRHRSAAPCATVG